MTSCPNNRSAQDDSNEEALIYNQSFCVSLKNAGKLWKDVGPGHETAVATGSPTPVCPLCLCALPLMMILLPGL